ncbi:MAG TPA: nucleoside hydrolase, partial [Bacteroidales bacterium]|nr:nucleoside hydrolase [Bacteroidales bacterium]
MKSKYLLCLVLLTLTCLIAACIPGAQKKDEMIQEKKIPVILDTDANNELDDQHAIAYMLFNQDFFDIKGITVNKTRNGGLIEKHVEEAQRVVNLCGFKDKVKVIPGASGKYYEIFDSLEEEDYDGQKAVEFIINEARQSKADKLVL